MLAFVRFRPATPPMMYRPRTVMLAAGAESVTFPLLMPTIPPR